MNLKPIRLVAFERAVRKWQRALGLLGWEVDVKWGTSDGGRHRAAVEYNLTGRTATIYLARDGWAVEPAARELERCAFHELWHLVLARFRAECEARPHSSGNGDAKEDAMHEIIRLVENLTFGLGDK